MACQQSDDKTSWLPINLQTTVENLNSCIVQLVSKNHIYKRSNVAFRSEPSSKRHKRMSHFDPKC